MGKPPTSPWPPCCARCGAARDRKSTRLNSSHSQISYAVFCLKKKKDSDCNVGHDDTAHGGGPSGRVPTLTAGSASSPSTYATFVEPPGTPAMPSMSDIVIVVQ